QMTQRREEPAMDIFAAVAPVLSVLPTAMLESITGSVIGSDVQASNVPVYPGDTYLAGAKILRQYGLGPLPGVAMMVVLISRGGMCTITVRYDRAAVKDEALFGQCLLEGFDEILALAGEPAPHAVPATIWAEQVDSSLEAVSGS
ncbi:MAG: WSD1 family O-acyltransferase, partial [Mycobacteriaceae bacterium]|nr:WSD1 family O-acyltransferase [Mycobacteriaceae bacterium]